MFVLRMYTGKEKIETNHLLGSAYKLVRKKYNQIEFDRILNDDFKKERSEIISAFIVGDIDGDARPIFKSQKAYIMTESGNTFARIE